MRQNLEPNDPINAIPTMVPPEVPVGLISRLFAHPQLWEQIWISALVQASVFVLDSQAIIKIFR
jgi:hypothetical protein